MKRKLECLCSLCEEKIEGQRLVCGKEHYICVSCAPSCGKDRICPRCKATMVLNDGKKTKISKKKIPLMGEVHYAFGKRQGTLSDWLNPGHKHFWKELKTSWKKFPKKYRKSLSKTNRDKVEKNNQVANFPFQANSDDHCETELKAYGDIEPLLTALAEHLGKSKDNLRIYDPYYCNGAVIKNLTALGFPNVYNKCEDFYKVAEDGNIPKHDLVVTNPPYSEDHVKKLLAFIDENAAPSMLLMPSYVSQKDFFPGNDFVFVLPRKRYVYWTPKGLRPKERRQNHAGPLGVRTSPFVSFWYVHKRLLKNEATLVKLLKKSKLRFHTSIDDLPESAFEENHIHKF